MFIHSCGCVTQRKSQSLHFILEESIAVMSLAQSPVFDLFPELKVIVPHGGGAIPYQIGRFRGVYWKSLGREDMTFDEAIRHNLYYDTCLYTPESLEFLLRTMGCDNVVFGTERPGDGSHKHSGAGSVAWADDLKTIIEEIPGFKTEELDKVFSGNTLSAYPRLADKFGVTRDAGRE
jgi:4-oxalmesaconate hydratase